MAIAFLRYEDNAANAARFKFDLGRNRYYAYAIGDDKSYSQNGIRLLENRSYTSPVFGPIPDEGDGRGQFEIPSSRLDKDNHSVQLLSYRTRNKVGPAVSKIVTVQPGDTGEDSGASDLNLSLSFSPVNTLAATGTGTGVATINRPRLRKVHARVRRKPLSRGMIFGIDDALLGGIGNALLSALPTVLPIIASAVGGTSAPPAAGGGSNIQGVLQGVLNGLLQAVGGAPRPPAPPAPATAPAAAAAPVRASSLVFQSSRPQVSQAMFAPALLAALPALMPVLQNVLSPQTIQGVLQTADPNRLIGTISNAIQGLGQLGAQIQQQQYQHLERLNPGVDDPALMNLLGQMSVNLKEVSNRVRYRRVESVKLHFVDISTINVEGRPVVAYKTGIDWSFPLAVQTPRPIPPGELRIIVKDAKTLKVVAEKREKTPPTSAGPIGTVLRIEPDQQNQIVSGQDYLVCAYLRWKNKSGEILGSHLSQLITAVDQFTFDGVEESGDVVPLNDVDKYRDFWHQAWTQDFSRDLIRIELECMYYFLMEPDETSNGHLETTTTSSEEGLHRSKMQMESGVLFSPNRLNELVPKISSHSQLDEKELAALLSPAFGKHVRLGARTSVKFAGRPGQTAALWVFPEVKVKQINLQEAVGTNPNGLITQLAPHPVYFPIPVLAHFVGVKSS